MSSFRCSTCAINWPADPKRYSKCAKCDGLVELMPLVPPTYSKEEAEKQRLYYEFEKEYALYEEGKPSKCGKKKPPTIKQQERVRELGEQGRFINEWECTFRYVHQKGES